MKPFKNEAFHRFLEAGTRRAMEQALRKVERPDSAASTRS